MMIVSQFRQLNLSVVNVRTYLFAVLFVGGNMLLPQLCHLMPDGGKIFLPIYFFTLIASYKFGLKVGILTAVLSPLCNHLLFGMPPAGMLPVLLVKSTLLALVGAIVADRSQRVSLLHIQIQTLIQHRCRNNTSIRNSNNQIESFFESNLQKTLSYFLKSLNIHI